MRRTLIAAALSLCATLAARAADLITIDRLAPKESWLVLGVDDYQAAAERWSHTPFSVWWNSEAVQKLVKEPLEKSRKDSADRLRELGLPEDAWSAPRTMGGALYAARDEQLDSDQAQFIMYGDWGDKADGVSGIFDAVLADFEKREPGRVKSVEIRGKKASAITVRPEEPKPEIGKDGRPRRPRPRRGGMFEEGGMFQHVSTIWYVRDGSRFLLGSVERDLDEAMGALEGQSRPSMSDDTDFKSALDQVSRGDGWAVLMTGPMQRVAGTTGPQLAFLQPMLTALFGEVKAYAFSLTSDQTDAQFELNSGILVKGDRVGVFALPDPPVAASAPPKFVQGDAVGYGRMQVQFRDMMKLLETAVSNVPEEMAATFEPTLQQYGPDLRKAFDALGPEVHVVQRYASKPGESDPETQGVYGIACRDEQAVTGLMNLFLPEAGFEPRDFNGNTVFSADGGETSFGFGGGMFYMGTTQLVEQSLRGGDGSLGESPACKQALAAVGTQPVLGWGYTDLVATLEVSRKSLIASASRYERNMVPKDQRDIADSVGLDLPTGLVDALKELDVKSLQNAFGPMQWDMRAVSNGLFTRTRLLKPAKTN